MATIAAELLHSAASTPNVSRPPSSRLGDAPDLIGDDLDDVLGRDGPQHPHEGTREVLQREEAAEREQEQDRGEEREEQVVGRAARRARGNRRRPSP